MAGRKPYETTEPTSYGSRPQPPDCLGDLQKQAFIDLVTSCPVSQFRKCDVALLCRWAELTVIAEQAAFEMQQGGMVVNGKPSPWFAIHRDTTRELRMLSQRLQVGPRGRTPKAPKTLPGSNVSYYETMRLEGLNDGPNTR